MSWWWWTLVPVAPAVVSSLISLRLAAASRRGLARPWSGSPARWLVLVPAREEGASVQATLASVVAAAEGHDVRTVLVLDGPDAAAASVAEALGVAVTEKTPAGPSKGAVLAWAAQALRREIEERGAVLVLDVGSTLAPGFFASMPWPGGADAVQARLVGRGSGVGEAVALSERMAQTLEDGGRQALGWSVQLRGTGSAFSPEAFLSTAPRLVTRVEDKEASLLLAADGRRAVLGPEGAAVIDDKPEAAAGAARQRARWLLGQLTLPLRHPGACLRLLARRPLEGLAVLSELGARPLALTVPLRAAAALALVLGVRSVTAGVAGALVAATAGADLGRLAVVGRLPPGAALRLLLGWLGALVMLPFALFGWQRARPSAPPDHRDDFSKPPS